MAKQQQDNQPKIAAERPTMASVSPRFAAAMTKYAELRGREAEIEDELRPLAQEVRSNRHLSLSEIERQTLELPRPPVKPIDASPRAKELLGDLAPDPKMPGDVRDNILLRHPTYARMRELSSELDAVREALKHVAETLEYERKKATLALAPLLREEYAAIAQQYAAALVALGNVRAAHDRYIKERRAEGMLVASLRPVVSELGGDPLDKDSDIRRALAWAIEAGHVESDVIPAEWRAKQ
jgi:hypothetical protein